MRIAVLGGGVSGITTALLLQTCGYDTTVVTAARADAPAGADWPRLASHYPAASVIPHTVQIRHPARHTRWSQACFDVFVDAPGWGVRTQRHAELFEQPPEPPAYLGALRALSHLPDDGRGAPGLPRRSEAAALFGWTFNMTFVDAPRYLRQLYRCYTQIGGTVQRMRLTPETRSHAPGDVWINCLGAGAPHVFPDRAPASFLHGHLLHVNAPVAASGWSAPVQSYNYAPAPSCYPSHQEGEPGGLYFYPRSKTWVIGGTKHPARRSGGYTTPLRGPTRHVNGVALPEAMWTTNASLIQQLTGVDFRTAPLRVVSGLRYLRDPHHEGVRLEWDADPERPTFHNYGHGGAGVTLSWSCALHVLHALRTRKALTGPPAHARSNASDHTARLRALHHTARHLLDTAPASLSDSMQDSMPGSVPD